jgi:hypothetical protein
MRLEMWSDFRLTRRMAPRSSQVKPRRILIISTNALNYTDGFSSVIDGGVMTVASFEPAAPVPEPASLALLGTA